jgi:hypothetical protein
MWSNIITLRKCKAENRHFKLNLLLNRIENAEIDILLMFINYGNRHHGKYLQIYKYSNIHDYKFTNIQAYVTRSINWSINQSHEYFVASPGQVYVQYYIQVIYRFIGGPVGWLIFVF